MKILIAAFFALCLSFSMQAAEQNVTPDEAERLLKENPAIVVLDVRTPEEFASGHLPKAKNLDFMGGHFPQELKALDKSTTYLIHCQGGGRSGKACKLMGEDQFAHVYHMNGGFSAWEKSGKPIVK